MEIVGNDRILRIVSLVFSGIPTFAIVQQQ